MNLNLSEQLENSECGTLVFCRAGRGETKSSDKVCVVECADDFRSPPPEITSLEKIRSIRFENFRSLDLSAIFTTLAAMPNLEELYFYHSEIKSIPPQIGQIRRLRRLTFDTDVSGSLKSWEIKTVPPEFGNLENLQEITFINCVSFYKGFPPESAKLHNLKTVKFTDTNAIKKLPENIERLPNLEHLYFSGATIQPPDLEPILAASKTLKSVAVKGSFHRFEELAEKYPRVEFYNDGVKFDAELDAIQNEPEKLPQMREWLKENRSERAQAQYAYLMMKKYFERAGIELRKTEIPATFASFGWEFYLNVSPVLRQPEHAAMLKSFFAEIVLFYEAIHGEFFASSLLGILESFIDRDPPRSLIVPLLPEKALAQFDEMNEILDRQHERFMEIQNQMGY
jgi:hypothetical protein